MKYKGMMRVQCVECRKIGRYKQNIQIDEHVCIACGSRTRLEDLKELYINCECGYRACYHTNETELLFDEQCHNCEQPVAIEYDRKRNNFMTVNRPRKYGGR